jgi:hypothetical protein
VVDGDVSNVTNLGQDKVVHGVNIERIVVSQSLVDSYGIEKITSGMKAHFSANSEVAVDGDLSELRAKLRALIENIEEDLDKQIGPNRHSMGGILAAHGKESLLSELEFLQFGQKYANNHDARRFGTYSQIELLGFNSFRNHILVEVFIGTSKVEAHTKPLGPTLKHGPVVWGASRICAITIEEFCDYYRGFGDTRPTMVSEVDPHFCWGYSEYPPKPTISWNRREIKM